MPDSDRAQWSSAFAEQQDAPAPLPLHHEAGCPPLVFPPLSTSALRLAQKPALFAAQSKSDDSKLYGGLCERHGQCSSLASERHEGEFARSLGSPAV